MLNATVKIFIIRMNTQISHHHVLNNKLVSNKENWSLYKIMIILKTTYLSRKIH